MDTNQVKIYVVKRSISYDIMGEEYDISHHITEEGAYIKMDAIAINDYNFTSKDILTYNDSSYIYSRDNESIYVQSITLEN
jgi:hypothetical protein